MRQLCYMFKLQFLCFSPLCFFPLGRTLFFVLGEKRKLILEKAFYFRSLRLPISVIYNQSACFTYR